MNGVRKLHFYLVLAASVSALATDMIVPSLPVIQTQLKVSYSLIQLTISGFLIVYAISQLAYGFIGEKAGKSRTLFVSFAVFATGSLICYFAQDIYFLLFGRVVQAIGAGAGPVLSRAIAKETFSANKLKAALSDISAASAVVPLIAPLLGGVLLGWFNWNVIFLVMFIFGIVTLFLTPAENVSKQSNQNQQQSFITREFITGTILVSLMLGSLFCFISLSPVIFIEQLHFTSFSYSVIFSASVLCFMIGNQLSKLEKLVNPYVLFPVNALMALPFLFSVNNVYLIIAAIIIYNLTLGIYYPAAHYLALQIRGGRTGIAASVTGFTQTIVAGVISFIFVRFTAFGYTFQSVLGTSILLLAIISVVVLLSFKGKSNGELAKG